MMWASRRQVARIWQCCLMSDQAGSTWKRLKADSERKGQVKGLYILYMQWQADTR